MKRLLVLVFILIFLLAGGGNGFAEKEVKSKVDPYTIVKTREKVGEQCVSPFPHVHIAWYYSKGHEIPLVLTMMLDEGDGKTWLIVAIYYLDGDELMVFRLEDKDSGEYKHVPLIDLLQEGVNVGWIRNDLKQKMQDHLDSLKKENRDDTT